MWNFYSFYTLDRLKKKKKLVGPCFIGFLIWRDYPTKWSWHLGMNSTLACRVVKKSIATKKHKATLEEYNYFLNTKKATTIKGD